MMEPKFNFPKKKPKTLGDIFQLQSFQTTFFFWNVMCFSGGWYLQAADVA